MIFTSLAALALVAGPVLAQTASQVPIIYDDIHNSTSIVGTWSSGSKAVQTGAGFAQPANETFTYPATAGISYSFSDDGFYEISRYRWVSNATEPNCITGVMVWCHGTYDLLSNGSIIMTPFGDGYQQIQDPCGAESNFIQPYNDTELYIQWRIFTDPYTGYHLHLFQFDGAPLAPQFQISTTPNMLPTKLLKNVTTETDSNSTLATAGALAVNAGQSRRSPREVMGLLAMILTAGVASLLL